MRVGAPRSCPAERSLGDSQCPPASRRESGNRARASTLQLAVTTGNTAAQGTVFPSLCGGSSALGAGSASGRPLCECTAPTGSTGSRDPEPSTHSRVQALASNVGKRRRN